MIQRVLTIPRSKPLDLLEGKGKAYIPDVTSQTQRMKFE